MSYEGYVQVLCRYGHLSLFDAYDDTPTSGTCAQCGAPYVWAHDVDETNGEGQPATLVCCEEAEYLRCNLGEMHCIRAARYEMPTNVGRRLDK